MNNLTVIFIDRNEVRLRIILERAKMKPIQSKYYSEILNHLT